MKRKVLLCALTVLVLLVSTQPAAALLSNELSTVIEGTSKMPTISVIVPSSREVYINPFQLPVSIDYEVRRDQIVCTPAVIANASDIPLKVSVTVTGTINSGSDMTLASAPTKGLGTAKSAFIYFEIVQSNSDETDRRSLWSTEYDSTKHIRVVANTPQTKTDILTLPAIRADGDIARGGYAPFRLAGDAVWTPKSAWNEKDGINVTVAFTFTPVPYVT